MISLSCVNDNLNSKFFRGDEETEKVEKTPRKILFAQLVPKIKNSKAGKVKSVLGSTLGINYNPGAKRIDVISRVMFPGTFACLNIAYWAYYLTMAENANMKSLKS